MAAYRVDARRQRGVSLVEALVAFGVMAFGMMAVVGMQATLRANGDLSRQRAEAVRIAQDAIEEWRGFTVMAATADRMSFADIATTNAVNVVGTNATYQLARRVNPVDDVPGTVTPQRRTLVVDVTWQDRGAQTQSVRLASMIAGLEPSVAASLVLGANPDPVIAPLARHRGIPTSAVTIPGARSGFVPPGQEGAVRVAWVFNNLTGVITLCTTTGVTNADLLLDGTAPVCGANRALLVSGAVRFTPLDPSLAVAVANPSGVGFPLFGLALRQTLAGGALVDNSCYQQPMVDTQVLYYCAVPITAETPNWTGRLNFGAPLAVAATVLGNSAAEHKVCRYHAADSYTSVSPPLLSQNFVIVWAGDGTASYQCPVVGTPRTWPHQPV